jgi:hypothetical protein
MAPKKTKGGAAVTGKKRKRKDPDAPKAPPTAYVLFCKDQRPRVMAENPNADFAESNRKLGELWKGTAEEERLVYSTTAAKLRVEYQKERLKYKAEHPKQSSDEDDASPKKRRKRAKRDPDAPKKPTSAYFYFQKKIRAAVKDELGEKAAVGDIAKKIAEKWRGLSATEKQPFNDLAEEDRERYRKEKLAYDKKVKTVKTVCLSLSLSRSLRASH